MFSSSATAAIKTAKDVGGGFAARVKTTEVMHRAVADALERASANIHAVGRHGRVLVYCGNGGASSSMLADTFAGIGMDAAVLVDGYPSYRRWVTHSATTLRDLRVFVVAGLTGTGKGRALTALEALGAQVIDLEGLAEHKGSIFGKMSVPQPTQKMFESRLVAKTQEFDPSKPVFVEGEGRRVGQLHVPLPLFENMVHAPSFRLDVPLEVRVANLREDYAHFQTTDITQLRAIIESFSWASKSQRVYRSRF